MTGFFGQVWFFENTLCAVDVGQIKGRAGMAGIENGSQANAGLKRRDQNSVHLVVNNVTGLSEINRVNDFIVAILFISVKVLGLSTMT